ncbi:double-stranded RNA-specific adenosine deaminase-like isoform X2 [Mytilus californianus]|uniref:double-stranded RNA-specific adenosine deaminase-like isoform X2 n=1 Tax=Mytilus californianus TaxID=6549 RepID=UPI002247B997|nr:double-stranded RNA-specific adenosine deaminase-like isoform X2 [Mytilus californianus]
MTFSLPLYQESRLSRQHKVDTPNSKLENPFDKSSRLKRKSIILATSEFLENKRVRPNASHQFCINNNITSRDDDMNAKCILNEWKQQKGKVIKYTDAQESGPDHEKSFRVNVYVDGVLFGTGTGSRKKEAQQSAAISAVRQLRINTDAEIGTDPKSQLNEKLQEHHIRNIKYETIARTGPDHAPTFIVQLFINDTLYAKGTGSSKQNADRSAARQTLKQFDEGILSFSDLSDQNNNDENSHTIPKDAKCILNDWVQSRRKSIAYEQADKYGPDHALRFEVDLFIGGELVSSGLGTSLQRAELDAANKAIQQISEECGDCYPTVNSPRYLHLSHYDELAMITHKTFESVTHNVIVSIDKESVVASVIMENCRTGQKTVLSLGSGNVFVDEESLGNNGETVIDSHAEIIAKRGFQRVLYQEVYRLKREKRDTLGMLKVLPNGRIALQSGIKIHLYISKAPCGDGSVFTLSQPGSHTDTGNIHNPIQSDKKQGLLRAKIARGEGAIPVSELPDDRLHKMCCSDKICKWNVLGLQGALLSSVMDSPLFLSSVVVGDVYNFNHLSRALCCRVKKQSPLISSVMSSVTVNHPEIAISTICDLPEIGKSKPVSVNWNIVDVTTEVTNGRTGKVSPDLYLKSTPPDSGINSRLCKKELFCLYKAILPFPRLMDRHTNYHKAKMSAEQYQAGKTNLYQTFIEKGYGKWAGREDVDQF